MAWPGECVFLGHCMHVKALSISCKLTSNICTSHFGENFLEKVVSWKNERLKFQFGLQSIDYFSCLAIQISRG
jgi:hypothetical protein